jgi:hydrogenase nickel incorporation protein HypB
MCVECGCDHDARLRPAAVTTARAPKVVLPGGRRVRLEERLLAKNDALAGATRDRLRREGVLALNVLGSPGAGKTSLLERTVRALAPAAPVSVVEGDQATDHDARRMRAAGCAAVQVNTGAGCHLDAGMVARALDELAPPRGGVVFVENVGNLVCPALFDLGERAKVVVAALTEGEDKPLKYPHMFRAAAVVLLNKVDLAPHLGVELERWVESIHRVNRTALVLPVSATRGDGFDAWLEWVLAERARVSLAIG